MPRYRYETQIGYAGIVEAVSETQAETNAENEVVERIFDGDLDVTFTTTVTELSEGDTKK